jgi:hypothetical protein
MKKAILNVVAIGVLTFDAVLIWYYMFFLEMAGRLARSEISIESHVYYTSVSAMMGLFGLSCFAFSNKIWLRLLFFHFAFHRLVNIFIRWYCYYNDFPLVWEFPQYSLMFLTSLPFMVIIWLLMQKGII